MFEGGADTHYLTIPEEDKRQLYSGFIENKEVRGEFMESGQNIIFRIPGTRPGFVFKDFSIDVPFDLINDVSLRLGSQIVECLKPEWFDVLHFAYEIEKTNGRLPFYLGKVGLVGAVYHTIDIVVNLKVGMRRFSFFTPIQPNFKMNFNKYTSLLSQTPTIEMVYYQTNRVSWGGRRLPTMNHPVTHLFIDDDLSHLELSVHGVGTSGISKVIILRRIKQIGCYSVFSFVSSLDDYEHTINFTRVDEVYIIVDDDHDFFTTNTSLNPVIAINRQILRNVAGMYGVKWSS